MFVLKYEFYQWYRRIHLKTSFLSGNHFVADLFFINTEKIVFYNKARHLLIRNDCVFSDRSNLFFLTKTLVEFILLLVVS